MVSSVDIRQLPGAWFAELLGVQDYEKDKIFTASILAISN